MMRTTQSATRAISVCLLLLALMERAAVSDTILQLYLESSRTFDSDLDCTEIVDRTAPDGETGSFVAQGQ